MLQAERGERFEAAMVQDGYMSVDIRASFAEFLRAHPEISLGTMGGEIRFSTAGRTNFLGAYDAEQRAIAARAQVTVQPTPSVNGPPSVPTGPRIDIRIQLPATCASALDCGSGFTCRSINGIGQCVP